MSDTPDTATISLTANVACASCGSPAQAVIYDLTCPLAMFGSEGQTMFRLHRSKFLTYFANVYDELIGNVRAQLREKYPDKEFPDPEQFGITVIDTTALQKAIKQETKMTPVFKAKVRKEVQQWRRNGTDAATAARELEILCGKSNEDYGTEIDVTGRGKVPEGQLLVEEVYAEPTTPAEPVRPERIKAPLPPPKPKTKAQKAEAAKVAKAEAARAKAAAKAAAKARPAAKKPAVKKAVKPAKPAKGK